MSLNALLSTLGLSLFYAWSGLTFFCITNQITGIEEDRIDKPDRPLPSGMISIPTAAILAALACLVFLLTGLLQGVGGYAGLFVLASLLHNLTQGGNHWFFKNLLVAIGIFSVLAAGWNMIRPADATTWIKILFMALSWLFLAQVQDFRDLEGDLKNNRRTMPIVMGETRCRLMLALGFLSYPAAVYFAFPNQISFGFDAGIGLMIALLSVNLGYRVLKKTNKSDDVITYRIFVVLFLLTLSLLFISDGLYQK